MMPNLTEHFAEECTLLEKRRIPDGEGGWSTSWIDGIKFRAAITNPNTIESRVAEKDGMTATYTVTTEKNMRLEYHDVFRRESDGQTFRAKSDSIDVKTPDVASFQFAQASAERWMLEE